MNKKYPERNLRIEQFCAGITSQIWIDAILKERLVLSTKMNTIPSGDIVTKL